MSVATVVTLGFGPGATGIAPIVTLGFSPAAAAAATVQIPIVPWYPLRFQIPIQELQPDGPALARFLASARIERDVQLRARMATAYIAACPAALSRGLALRADAGPATVRLMELLVRPAQGWHLRAAPDLLPFVLASIPTRLELADGYSRMAAEVRRLRAQRREEEEEWLLGLR